MEVGRAATRTESCRQELWSHAPKEAIRFWADPYHLGKKVVSVKLLDP